VMAGSAADVEKAEPCSRIRQAALEPAVQPPPAVGEARAEGVRRRRAVALSELAGLGRVLLDRGLLLDFGGFHRASPG